MSVPVTCSSCNAALEIDREHVGWRVRCPKCSQIFLTRVGPGVAVPEGGGGGVPSPYAQTYTPPQGWSGNPSPPPVFSVAAPAAAIQGPGASTPVTQPFVAPPPLPPIPTPPVPPPPPPGSVYEVFAPPVSAPPGAPMLRQARTAFIFGILALACLHMLAGIPAVIVGVRARRKIRESGGQFAGDHLALAGIIMGAIGILLTVSDWNSPFSLVRILKNPFEVHSDTRKPSATPNGRPDRR
jgi:hypothetical protein